MKGILSVFRRAIRFYRSDGLQKLLREIKSEIVSKTWALSFRLRGRYTLSVGDTRVTFPTPSIAFIEQNVERFRYEEQQLVDILDEIRPEDIVYDVGANTGLFTLFAAQHCTEGKVIAFEPYPPNSHVLAREIHYNEIQNAEVYGIALSDDDGIVSLSSPVHPEIGYGSAYIENRMAPSSETSIKISCLRGDTLIDRGDIPAPSVVKIDVEGVESRVIEGLREALSLESCRLVYCEIHTEEADHRPSITDIGMTLDDFEECFEAFGYAVERFQERESEVVLKAGREDIR